MTKVWTKWKFHKCPHFVVFEIQSENCNLKYLSEKNVMGKNKSICKRQNYESKVEVKDASCSRQNLL